MSGTSVDPTSIPPLSDITLVEFRNNTTGDIWNELLGRSCPLLAVSARILEACDTFSSRERLIVGVVRGHARLQKVTTRPPPGSCQQHRPSSLFASLVGAILG